MNTIPTVKEDLRLIHRALKSWQRFTREHRYGGLWAEWDECKQAIEAFERVGVILQTRQMELPGLTPEDKEINEHNQM